LAAILGAADPKLVQYLTVHQGKARYLFATRNATSAAPYILQTGKPVMALGGFTGGDDILTLADLQRLIASGEVRYFLLPSSGRDFSASPGELDGLSPQVRDMLDAHGGFGGLGMFGGFSANVALTNWVGDHCAVVPSSQWSSTRANSTGRTTSRASGQSADGGFGPFGGAGEVLYDCAGR
jgi:4-amino-4-deoxy-L-arabinose transferase-like glycosyltransferase